MTPAGVWPRLAAGLAGILAAAAAFSLRQVLAAGGDGLYAGISRFEVLSWLGTYLLLLPGLLLLAWALAPSLPSARGGRPTERRVWVTLLVLIASCWVLEYRALRWYFADDRPATPAESALLFGARLWAAGELSVPAFERSFGFAEEGIVRRGERVYPRETPGALLVAATAEASGLGPLLFALLAAGSGLALALSCVHLDGRPGQGVAVFLWSVSPMVLLLGSGTGGELVGRSFLAFAWAAWLALAADPPLRHRLALALLLGLAAALAILSRPVDAACLLLPVWVHLLWLARERGRRTEPILAAAFAASGIAGGVFYAQATGGLFWPDVAAGAPAAALAASASLALLLICQFAGPLLLPLLGLALSRGGEAARAAASALLLLLARPLLFGAAAVQTSLTPAASGAATVPLLVLAVVGIAELRRRLLAGGLSLRPWAFAGAAAGAALLVLVSYPLAAIGARSDLLRALEAPAAAIEAPAIVVVEPAPALWRLRPDLGLNGVWRGEVPHPDPFLRDRVVFARGEYADLAVLSRVFPRRQLYFLRATGGQELYRLERLR